MHTQNRRMDPNNDLFDSSNFSLYEKTCRTCLKLLKDNYDKKFIFQQNIKNKIGSLTSVNLYEEDGLPNFICDICFEKLNNAVEFKKQVETINEVLKQYVNNLITENNGLKSEKVSEVIKDQIKSTRGREKNHKQNGKIIDEDNVKSDISGNSINVDVVLKRVDKDVNEHIKESKRSRNIKKQSVLCPTCGKKFKSTTSLKTHLRTHRVIEKKLKCDDCGKKYTNQYDLRVHLRKHSGARPYPCKVCQKTFADQRCFEKHKKIHSGEKLFKCELCDKSFIHSYTLRTHQRVHSGEKPFICAKCGHSFATTTQLKLHTRIHHTQEKPYNCNLCSKVFVSSSGLSNHKMTHTGERKFICSVCGKGSRTTSDLTCHLRTHTGERPFKCTFPDCDKKYKTNSQLCTHIRTHTGEKNHTCEICQKKFSNITQLKSHICIY